jgi:hypothetical protein
MRFDAGFERTVMVDGRHTLERLTVSGAELGREWVPDAPLDDPVQVAIREDLMGCVPEGEGWRITFYGPTKETT